MCYYWQLHLKHINNSILVGHTLSQEDLEILMNFSLGYYLATNNLLTHLLQNFPSISYTNIKYWGSSFDCIPIFYSFPLVSYNFFTFVKKSKHTHCYFHKKVQKITLYWCIMQRRSCRYVHRAAYWPRHTSYITYTLNASCKFFLGPESRPSLEFHIMLLLNCEKWKLHQTNHHRYIFKKL